MFKKLEFNWENLFYSLIWVTCLTLIIGITVWTFSSKNTIKYSLGGDNGKIYIVREINNYEDDKIILDRNITYEQASEIIRKLNETLK